MTVGSPGHICAFAGVNNKGRPSQPSPPSHRARACDGCDDGDVQRLLLWPAHASMPQAKGVLPGDIPIRGARAQHFATVRPENKVCRVCGSHPAMWVSRLNAASALACAGLSGTRKVRTWVRTGFAGLHPGHTNTAREENSMLVRVCRRSTAGNRKIGHRDRWRKGLQKLDTLGG